jgi:hypothetical protein
MALRTSSRPRKPEFAVVTVSYAGSKDVLSRKGYRNTRTPKQQREFERTLSA